MANARQEFDISASLLELYKDLPYVTKLGYTVGELGERILVRVIIEGDKNDDEFHEYSMAAVGKALDFEDRMPASMRERYEVVPIVTDPYEGALSYFDSIAVVIDRRAEAVAKAPGGGQVAAEPDRLQRKGARVAGRVRRF